MANEPQTFPTLEQLIERLKSSTPTLKKKAYASLYGFDMDDIICTAVEANTIRGFNQKKLGLKESPMNIYRDWASDFVMWLGYSDFKEVADQESFEAFFRKARLSCDKAFQKAGAKELLTYGQTSKLVDLLLKRLVRFPEIPDAERIRLSQFLHVPLEKYCLLAVRELDVIDKAGEKVNIPKSATMSFITKEEVYYAIQDLFRDIATEAEVPPIFIDYLLWDMMHVTED
jgi:hypothetical protein